MGYTDVFGGELLFPSQLSYLLLTTPVDVTLQWPREQQIEGGNVVADFLDIDATAGSINISMPDARNTSTGNKTTINNVGSNDFDVVDNTGGSIVTVEQGKQWVVVLTDNSTQAGTWSTFQLGATMAVAQAAALAGAGIKSITNTLNQKIDSDIEGLSPITVVDGDRAKCLIWTGGAGQADLPDPGVVMDDWFFMIRNSGTGTLTIMPPSGQIDGSANITLEPNGSTFVFTDGTDFFTVGLTTSSTIGFDFVSIPVPGSGDFVLSGANVDRISYRFTGALTGNRRIVVPNTTQQYWCDNQTTGAFQLTISTNAQVTPPELEQGETAIFYCDSVDVINAVNATTISLPLSVVQGGTGANNPTDARNNLEAAHDELDMIAGDGLIGGGTLEADRTFAVGAGIGVGVNPDDVFLDLTTVIAAVPAAGDFVIFQDIDDTDITKKATITDLTGQTSQLSDSGGNVRVSAELLGVAQLRSDGNTDLEVRKLDFTHTDQTLRGYVGYDGGDLLAIRNQIHGGALTLSAEDTGGTAHPILIADPDVNLRINSANDLALEVGSFNIALFARAGAEVQLRFNAIEVARTLTAANGGFEVNNLDTGAGFERVLTDPGDVEPAATEAIVGVTRFSTQVETDAGTDDTTAITPLKLENKPGGGGGAFRGAKAYQTFTALWPLNNTPNFAAGGPPGLAEAAQPMNSQVFDTDAIWSNAQPTRFITPAGVSRVILRAGYVINGDTSGGYRHFRFRLNGTLSLDPAQGSWVSQTSNSAAGSGSWWGGIANSGVITVANPGTDYFEVYALRQNSSGFTIANTVWMEMEIVA